MIVTGPEVVRFAETALERPFVPPFTEMGLARDGKVIAAVIFNGFIGTDIDVSVAGKGWTRGFVREVGRYVFDQLGCLRMTAITHQVEVADMACRLGATMEGVMRNHFGPNRDGLILGILREDWRVR